MTGVDGLSSDPDMVGESAPNAGGSGWFAGHRKSCDREFAVDVEQLFDFLKATQPEETAKLGISDYWDSRNNARPKFLVRLQGEISRRGTIDVLRNGIKHGVLSFDLLYGTPSPENRKAVERHAQNRFTITRQLAYSREETKRALDLCAFINGLRDDLRRLSFENVHGGAVHWKMAHFAQMLRVAFQDLHWLHMMQNIMSEVTRILSQIESGDLSAAEKLLPLIYDELHRLAAARMACEKAGHLLQPTALVHEAWLRLVDQTEGEGQRWNSRAHFFSAAAEAMRRILVDAARRRLAFKRGGRAEQVEFEPELFAARVESPYLLEVHELLECLHEVQADAAEVVKLRYFAGLSVADTAAAMGISPRSVDRLWAYARAWLFARLQSSRDSE